MPAIVPRPYEECKRLYAEECRRLAEAAQAAYTRQILGRLYVIGETRTGNFGEGFYDLQLRRDYEETPEGMGIVIQERIPSNLTIDQLAGWMNDRLKRSPLWMFCD